MALQIEDPDKKTNNRQFALFALGFRPFFLLAAITAPVLLTLWLLHLSGSISISPYYMAVGWHAHEMLFGFAVAVIAGFLLTATGNWTGVKMINGWRLILLAIVFVAARVAVFVPGLPYGLLAFLDLSFLPLLAVIVALPIIKVRQWSNIIFVPLLLIMALANFIVHSSALGMHYSGVMLGNRIMLYMVVLLIMIMGGRVIPFFTERGIAGVTTRKWQWVEWLVPLSLLAVAVADIFSSSAIVIGSLAVVAAVVNGIRLAGWYSNRIWKNPLVWILQVAYGWFVIGFMLKALVLLDLPQYIFAYHALTVGGIGLMTLGMMARVSLGHTGRDMVLPAYMQLAFILLLLAAVVRVLLPMLLSDSYLLLLKLSGSLWIAAFIIFLLVYAPMWWRARVDGRPG